MADILTLIFSLSTILIPLCGFGIVFLIVLIGIILVIRKRMTPTSPKELAATRAKSQTWLNSKRPELAPWQRTSLNDLSADWRGTYSQWVRLEAKGTIRSLSDHTDLVAYYLLRSTDPTILWAETSTQRWQIEFEKGVAKIYLDDRPFGQWRLSDGALFDEIARPVGQAKRKGGLNLFINGIATQWRDRFYKVTLYDRAIGAINNIPEGSAFLRSVTGGNEPPLVQTAGSLLDAEAEDWLLALAIIEAGYYSVLEYISSRRSRRN
jgi:hypothetical protein